MREGRKIRDGKSRSMKKLRLTRSFRMVKSEEVAGKLDVFYNGVLYVRQAHDAMILCAAACTGQYSSAPDGVLRVFAADESVAYKYSVTTLEEIIKATGDLSVAEKQQLVASLLVSLRNTDGELPPPRLSSPDEIVALLAEDELTESVLLIP